MTMRCFQEHIRGVYKMLRMNFPGRKQKRRVEAENRRFKFLRAIGEDLWSKDDKIFMKEMEVKTHGNTEGL